MTTPSHIRCPGCFNWTPSDRVAMFTAGMLDPKKSYPCCPRCALILDNEELAKRSLLAEITRNIGSYAGWSKTR